MILNITRQFSNSEFLWLSVESKAALTPSKYPIQIFSDDGPLQPNSLPYERSVVACWPKAEQRATFATAFCSYERRLSAFILHSFMHSAAFL